MTARRTQRERLQRAKMVARHHARAKAAASGGTTTAQAGGGDRPPRSRTAIAADGRDDGDDAENRDASNVTAPAREGPPAQAAPDAAPPKTREAFGAPARQIAAASTTPSQSPAPPARGTARQRARALSDAKRKLAASRAAAARTAASGKGAAQAGAATADAPTSAGGAKWTGAPSAAAPPRARTEAPRASSGAAAPSVPQGDGGAGTVANKAAPKAQPSHGAGNGGRSGAMKAQRERFLRMQAAKEHGGGAPPSAGKGKESPAPEPAEEASHEAPPAAPSADRRLRLQAAGAAGGDAPDDLEEEEAPLDRGGLGLKCSASGESVDSSAFLGVVTASESLEEWEDPPSGEEGVKCAAGVSEAGEDETLDGEGVLLSLSEDEGAEVVAANEETGAVAPGEEAMESSAARVGARNGAGPSPRPSDASGAFDTDAALWPADDFSSASWGSHSPNAAGDGWSDPFAEAVGPTENELTTQGAAREDPWPERTAGLTEVTFLPAAEEDKENRAWPADGAAFGAEAPAVAADDVGEEEEAWPTDEPAAPAAEETKDDDEDGVAPEEEPPADDKGALADEMGEAGSAQYQGFGSVLSDGRLLRGATQSMDEEEESSEDEGSLAGDEVCSSRASEASVGSATEFDPCSLFGEGDDVSPTMEDGVALADTTTTASALSWKPDDSSKSTSFPSMPPPRAKASIPAASPAGTESLESWWASRHAAAQNGDVDAAVREALAPREAPAPDHRADVGEAGAVVAEDEARAAARPKGPTGPGTNGPPPDEEDSIFSGLDDASHPGVRPTLAAQKYHSMATRATERASNTTAVARSESDEDLFSGMSMASRSHLGESKLSSQFPRLPESNAMKSLLDGASTAESPSVPPPRPPPPKPTNGEGAEAASRLFLPERGYGVVTTRASRSPTDRSVTSDITSSIVFGGDRDGAKKGGIKTNLRPRGILETTAEAPEPEEVSPLAGDVASLSVEGDVVEGHEPSQEMDVGSFGGSGEGRLSAASVGDESTASQTQTTVTDALSHFRESLLSRFGCGVLNTSSFAFCAAPAATALGEGQNEPSSEVSGPTDGAVALDDWSGVGEGPRRSRDDENGDGDEGPSSSSEEECQKSSSRFYATKDGGSAAPGDRGTATEHGTPSADEGKRWTSYDEALVAGAEKELDDGNDEGTAPPSAEGAEAHRMETREAQTKAYEGKLRYAYNALSVPQMLDFVEKGEGLEGRSALDPSVVCPGTVVLGREGADKILAKLSTEGLEVLKLNREKKWQPRFLTITREMRGQGIDARPLGLLWMKKFDARHRTVASIDKHGKGGMPFRAIERVSVTKDHLPLSRKQKKGPFKDSVTLVLHTETKREVLFRCARKDDAFALAAGVQAILDRVRGDRDKENALGPISPPSRTPTAAAKPFSPKALSSPVDEDRWEV